MVAVADSVRRPYSNIDSDMLARRLIPRLGRPLARLASSNPSIRVQKVSYTGGPESSERESLTSALAGIDAVVCTLAMSGIADEKNLIDAARAAGVKLFIPADYSSATSDPGARWLPVYALVVEMQRHLRVCLPPAKAQEMLADHPVGKGSKPYP